MELMAPAAAVVLISLLGYHANDPLCGTALDRAAPHAFALRWFAQKLCAEPAQRHDRQLDRRDVEAHCSVTPPSASALGSSVLDVMGYCGWPQEDGYRHALRVLLTCRRW
jgi:hypothetical protein